MLKRREYNTRLFALMDEMERGYKIVITPMNGPGEPDCFYWHLYHYGQKVNGGLVEDRIEEAQHRAETYRNNYIREVLLATHFWDSETALWIPRTELNRRS